MKVLSCGILPIFQRCLLVVQIIKCRIAAVFILWTARGQCRKILFYIIEIIFKNLFLKHMKFLSNFLVDEIFEKYRFLPDLCCCAPLSHLVCRLRRFKCRTYDYESMVHRYFDSRFAYLFSLLSKNSFYSCLYLIRNCHAEFNRVLAQSHGFDDCSPFSVSGGCLASFCADVSRIYNCLPDYAPISVFPSSNRFISPFSVFYKCLVGLPICFDRFLTTL